MSVLNVRVKNFKTHVGEHVISPKGNSFLLIGDSAKGKTSILELIAANLMQKPYPANPLSNGEDEGFTETEHLIGGTKYTIKRTFKRLEDGSVNLSRFSVVSESGGRYSLTEFLKKHLSDTLAASFDYATFFFEKKSPEARFKYMIDSIGGDAVIENNKKVSDLEQERAIAGTQRGIQKALWEQEGAFNAESFERDIEYYEKPREIQEAAAAKQEVLAGLVDITEIRAKADKELEEKRKREDLESLIVNDKDELVQIQKRMEFLKNRLSGYEAELAGIKYDESVIKDAEFEIAIAETKNKEVIEQADEKYEQMVEEITQFNANRKNFHNTIKSFREWQRLNTEWISLDEQIKSLRDSNKELFASKLPIPELSIGTVGGKEVVLYNGVEFCWENLSKGETIEVTAKIQSAINPNGDNFIIIPEAQSLGSKIDEVIEACKKFNMQACIEYTERNEEFRMEFVDDFLNPKDGR